MATWIVGKPFLWFLHEIIWISLIHFTSLVVVECASTGVESAIKAPWAPSIQYPQRALMVTWITVNPFYSVSSQQLSNILRQPEMAAPWPPSLQYPQKSLMVTWITVNPYYAVSTYHFLKPRNGTLNCCKHSIQHSQTTRNGYMNCW